MSAGTSLPVPAGPGEAEGAGIRGRWSESRPGQPAHAGWEMERGAGAEGGAAGAAGASRGKDAGTEPGRLSGVCAAPCIALLWGWGGFVTFLGLEPTLVMAAGCWEVLLVLLLLLLVVLQPHSL